MTNPQDEKQYGRQGKLANIRKVDLGVNIRQYHFEKVTLSQTCSDNHLGEDDE